MSAHGFQLNLSLAWIWILLGFLAGSFLGLNFHREEWLGGYGSFQRRLYRLGHISFFGLATVNLLFYFTVRSLPSAGPALTIASWGFLLGALTMPLCCVVMAHRPKWRLLFLIPVLSLIIGGAFTLSKVLNL